MAIRKPSTTPKARPAKARKVDTVTPKCNAVKAAVLASAELPETAVAMIAGMSGAALSSCKADRHRYQTTMVAMIGDALQVTETGMKTSIAEKEEKSSQAITIKASRQEAKVNAEANLQTKKETVSGTQAAITAATSAHQAAQAARKDAESKQKAEEKKMQVAADKSQQLSAFKNGTLLPLKEGTPESEAVDMKKVSKDISEIGREFNMEKVLLETVAGALRVKPGERGAFQEIALTQIADVVTKLIATLTGQLEQGTAAKAECEVAVASAKDTENQAKASLEARENEHEVAKHEVSAAKKALTAAEHSISNYFNDMRTLMDGLDKARAELTAFQAGPLAAYSDLEALEPEPDLPVVEESAASSSHRVGKFELFKSDKSGEFYFRLKASNGEIILASEGYKAKAGAENGIRSVRENASIPERFEKRENKNGHPYFVLKAGNSEIIGMSEMYEGGVSGRDNGIASVGKNAPDAHFVDITA